MATTTFDNLITFSRGSNATVTGPNGLIQWAPSNLLTNSQDFDSANWLKLAAGTGVAPTVTANAGVAPDGTTTADRAQLNRGAGTTASDVSRLFQNVALLPTDVGMLSVWLRSFDGVSTYTVGLTNGSASSTVTVTGVWQRFSLASISSTANAQVRLQGDITQQTADLLVWGAQIEPGPTVTTYNNTSVRNLFGFSEAFDNAAWSKTGASIVTSAQANPINGLFNAQKMMEDTSTGIHRILQAVTILAAPYTLSFYAKPAGRDWVYIYTDGGNKTAFVNISTGAVGSTVGSPVVATTSVGSGWYRVSLTFQNTTTVGQNLQIWLASNSTTTSYTGDGNSGVYIYGAQLSNSASLDPYVPTPGAAPSSTAYYGPRFDYDPVTLLPRGLLIEEQRANLATYSEQFNDAIWTKTRTSVSVNTTAAPDGTTTADTLVEDTTASNTHVLNRILGNPLAAATYTYSIYAKAAGRRYIELILIVDPASTNVRYATMFDLQTGAITTTSSASSPTATANAIQAAGNGWYRCVVTIGNPSGLRVDVSHALSDTPTAPALAVAPAYTGDGVSGAFLWGAQLEAGAFATSYIPTIASTVTRSADIAAITGSLFSQWYRQEEGSFLLEYLATADPAGTYRTQLQARNTGATSYSQIRNANLTPTTAVINNQVVVGGVTQADLPSASLGAGAVVKTTLAYRTNDFSAVTNGATPVTDTSGSVASDIALLAFNGGAFSAGQTWFRSIRYVPVRAADFQLQQVTT
jgi:hypothetical protein